MENKSIDCYGRTVTIRTISFSSKPASLEKIVKEDYVDGQTIQIDLPNPTEDVKEDNINRPENSEGDVDQIDILSEEEKEALLAG